MTSIVPILMISPVVALLACLGLVDDFSATHVGVFSLYPLPDWSVFVAKDSDSLARSVPGD